MSHALMQLLPHPENPPRRVRQITATLSFHSAGEWSVGFSVHPPEELLLAEPEPPVRRDGLWQHTCFELFVLDPATGAYLEYNFSPSGCWAAYRFEAYRTGQAQLDVSAIHITTSVPEQFDLGMAAQLKELGLDEETIKSMLSLDLGEMGQGPMVNFALNANCSTSDLVFPGQCMLALSAVIEETDGTKSYWALAHPPKSHNGGKPDFHHPSCFTVTLPPPSDP